MNPSEMAPGNRMDARNFLSYFGTDGAGKNRSEGFTSKNGFHIGDRVYSYDYANPKGGFYAEYVTVDANKTAGVPPRLDSLQAGAAATTGLTALQGIDNALRVRRGGDRAGFLAHPGQWALWLFSFAKRRGARVIATAL